MFQHATRDIIWGVFEVVIILDPFVVSVKQQTFRQRHDNNYEDPLIDVTCGVPKHVGDLITCEEYI